MTPLRRIRTAGVVELVLPGRRALECPGVIAGDRLSIRGIAVLPSGTGHQLQHQQHDERAPRCSLHATRLQERLQSRDFQGAPSSTVDARPPTLTAAEE